MTGRQDRRLDPISVAIAGLGQLGGGTATYLATHPRLKLVAAADGREGALAAFKEQYQGRAYPSVERLAADPDVEAVWVTTPSALHCEHVLTLVEHGKHVVVTKPIAVSLEQCDQMIEAADRNGVQLIYSGMAFSPAFLEMRRLVTSGRLGRLRALNHFAYSDWMLRPRELHEVESSIDGGQLFNQGPHPVDALRLIGGGLVRSVRGAMVELPLARRPSAGLFSAFLEFEDGTPASLSYNGYGYVFGWEFTGWGETANRMAAAEDSYAFRRDLQASAVDEDAMKEASRYGGQVEGEADFRSRRGRDVGWVPSDDGLIVSNCDEGAVRQSASGLYVYDANGRHEEPLPAGPGTHENEVDELLQGISGQSVFRDGRWGKATLEVVLAIAESARTNKEIRLEHQVATPVI